MNLMIQIYMNVWTFYVRMHFIFCKLSYFFLYLRAFYQLFAHSIRICVQKNLIFGEKEHRR